MCLFNNSFFAAQLSAVLSYTRWYSFTKKTRHKDKCFKTACSPECLKTQMSKTFSIFQKLNKLSNYALT